MAVCPECNKRYGLLDLDRTAMVQGCPRCSWTPGDKDDTDDDDTPRTWGGGGTGGTGGGR